MSVPIGEELVIVERGVEVEDGLGNTTWEFPGLDLTPLIGCNVQPGAHTYQDVGQDLSTVLWTVWAPPTMDWGTKPRAFKVTIPGVSSGVYQLVAQAQTWRSPTGELDHHVIYLEVFK